MYVEVWFDSQYGPHRAFVSEPKVEQADGNLRVTGDAPGRTGTVVLSDEELLTLFLAMEPEKMTEFLHRAVAEGTLPLWQVSGTVTENLRRASRSVREATALGNSISRRAYNGAGRADHRQVASMESVRRL